MKNILNHKSAEELDFLTDRRPAPQADGELKQKIIAQTENMAQEKMPAATRIRTQPARLKRFVPAISLFALALGASVLLNQPIPNQIEIETAVSADTILTTYEELAWQDVMLMHDELAFRDL